MTILPINSKKIWLKKASWASKKSQPSPKISNNESISIFSRYKMFEGGLYPELYRLITFIIFLICKL